MFLRVIMRFSDIFYIFKSFFGLGEKAYVLFLLLSSFREFRMLVGLKEGFFFERIFSMFDKNNDGQIVFTEFVKCLAFLTSRIPMEDRLQCMLFHDILQL